jgi:hypothetical protein
MKDFVVFGRLNNPEKLPKKEPEKEKKETEKKLWTGGPQFY